MRGRPPLPSKRTGPLTSIELPPGISMTCPPISTRVGFPGLQDAEGISAALPHDVRREDDVRGPPLIDQLPQLRRAPAAERAVRRGNGKFRLPLRRGDGGLAGKPVVRGRFRRRFPGRFHGFLRRFLHGRLRVFRGVRGRLLFSRGSLPGRLRGRFSGRLPGGVLLRAAGRKRRGGFGLHNGRNGRKRRFFPIRGGCRKRGKSAPAKQQEQPEGHLSCRTVHSRPPCFSSGKTSRYPPFDRSMTMEGHSPAFFRSLIRSEEILTKTVRSASLGACPQISE